MALQVDEASFDAEVLGASEPAYTREELAAEAEFDVTVVNTEVHAASEELVALIKNVPTHP